MSARWIDELPYGKEQASHTQFGGPMHHTFCAPRGRPQLKAGQERFGRGLSVVFGSPTSACPTHILKQNSNKLELTLYSRWA
eukprot:1153363-Pelagomonas_calceolata.AAC.7